MKSRPTVGGPGSSGDVLLSINGIDLTQLTYNEAVSVMKAQTAQSQVVLRVIQTLSEDNEEDSEVAGVDEMNPADDPRDDALNWTPLWTRWLGLPRYCLLYWALIPFVSTSLTLPALSATSTGAGTSSCRRPTTTAGASVSWGAMKRATASSLSSSKPSFQARPRTSMGV